MPEGHTLHRLAGHLQETFAGRAVRVSSPQGRFAEAAALLDGEVLTGAEAWGKHLFVAFPGDRHVHVHLGLYGVFAVHPAVDEGVSLGSRPSRASSGGVPRKAEEGGDAPASTTDDNAARRPQGGAQQAMEPGDTPWVPEPVGQVRLRLVAGGDDGGDDRPAAYADLRGATACELLTGAQRDAVVARQGPDPLRADADPDRAWERIRGSRAPIGGLLMDQTVLAGVGNVYRAELLFRHRIDPQRPGRTLRVGQWRAMWDDLVVLMAEGVRTGRIDTVRPEHTPEAMGRPPRRDDHGGEVYVYRRHGQPCLACGASVRTTELQQRNLFWCPRCQPRFRSRATSGALG
jgi:endonuclease-8